jgi:hypothetical protein
MPGFRGKPSGKSGEPKIGLGQNARTTGGAGILPAANLRVSSQALQKTSRGQVF